LILIAIEVDLNFRSNFAKRNFRDNNYFLKKRELAKQTIINIKYCKTNNQLVNTINSIHTIEFLRYIPLPDVYQFFLPGGRGWTPTGSETTTGIKIRDDGPGGENAPPPSIRKLKKILESEVERVPHHQVFENS
jgi:hypothetical protein